jgi:hypothetical protein
MLTVRVARRGARAADRRRTVYCSATGLGQLSRGHQCAALRAYQHAGWPLGRAGCLHRDLPAIQNTSARGLAQDLCHDHRRRRHIAVRHGATRHRYERRIRRGHRSIGAHRLCHVVVVALRRDLLLQHVPGCESHRYGACGPGFTDSRCGRRLVLARLRSGVRRAGEEGGRVRYVSLCTSAPARPADRRSDMPWAPT